jgi:hypothetical protein
MTRNTITTVKIRKSKEENDYPYCGIERTETGTKNVIKNSTDVDVLLRSTLVCILFRMNAPRRASFPRSSSEINAKRGASVGGQKDSSDQAKCFIFFQRET